MSHATDSYDGMIMERWSEVSVCVVCHIVRFYSVVDILKSGPVVCCSVVYCSLAVPVLSSMCSGLLIMSGIN